MRKDNTYRVIVLILLVILSCAMCVTVNIDSPRSTQLENEATNEIEMNKTKYKNNDTTTSKGKNFAPE